MLVIPSLRGSDSIEPPNKTINNPADSLDLEHTILKIDHEQRKQDFQIQNGSGLIDYELGVT